MGPINGPSDCIKAGASVPVLWPPNGKFVSENITGVTETDGDTVEVTITRIRQDEPLSKKSLEGAGVGSSAALLRSERVGVGTAVSTT